MDPVALPANLLAGGANEAVRAWAATLADTLPAVVERWDLEVDAPYEPGGRTAWVAPARTAAGDRCVLKLAFAHPEASGEADALRVWDGAGAVRLLDAEDLGATTILLLERCDPGTQLADRSEPEQDEVLTGLLRRLWIDPPPEPPFRSLQQMCDEWADGFERAAATRSADLDPGLVDPGLVGAGIGLLRELPATSSEHVLLCTDLHGHNVLAAQREPWLVIDPKPHVGDPVYDLVQHLLNCRTRLQADPIALCRRVADLAGVDPARLRLWLFARCVQQSLRWSWLAAVARRVAP
jgi:streptomycin 6-kinase